MIINTLMIKLKKQNDENILAAKKLLLSMKENIPQLKDIQVNADIRHGASSYDLIMIAQYETMDDMEAYIIHPLHVEVGSALKAYMETAVSVCYEQ